MTIQEEQKFPGGRDLCWLSRYLAYKLSKVLSYYSGTRCLLLLSKSSLHHALCFWLTWIGDIHMVPALWLLVGVVQKQELACEIGIFIALVLSLWGH